MTERFNTSTAGHEHEVFSEQDYRKALLRAVGEPCLPTGTTPQTVQAWQLLEARKGAVIFALNDPEWTMQEDVRTALARCTLAHEEEELAYARLLGVKARPSDFLAKTPVIHMSRVKESFDLIETHNTKETSLFCNWKRDILSNPVDYRYDESLVRLAKELALRKIGGLPNPPLDEVKTYMMKNLEIQRMMIDSRHYRLKEQRIYSPHDANEEALDAHSSDLAEHIVWLKILFPEEQSGLVTMPVFNPRGTMTQVWTGPESVRRIGQTAESIAFMHPILAAKKLEVPAEGGLILDGRRIGPKPADAVSPISQSTRDHLDDVL